MENINEVSSAELAVNSQLDSACGLGDPEIYTLSATKLSRNKQKIERRQFKERISDRRSTMRMSTDGRAQPDRRRANRVAYAEMYSRLRQPH